MGQSNIEKFSRSSWSVLILFGIIGQIAWSVENMYFNVFVFDTVAQDLDAITLMVQLSGITATVVTLVAGTLSDKTANRRSFISWGYILWGVSVALFGFLSPELVQNLFSVGDVDRAVSITLVLLIVADCVMTLFGSSANDAAFNAWITDNTASSYRTTVEGVVSILPLLAMLIVAGGFGILVEAVGYRTVFLVLGIIITASGVLGIFIIKDSASLKRSGSLRDIFYGFKPSVVKNNAPLYVCFLIIAVYGIACQIFMPYILIYMKSYLGLSPLEYSAIFAVAILLGAAVNLYLTRLSDRLPKPLMLYIAAAVMALGLFGMYLARLESKAALIALFGISAFVMICGYILMAALTGSTVRDYTPVGEVGKLQGVRMVFCVLIPMLVGPMIGNAINKSMNIRIEDTTSADIMTTEYIPAPEIFLAGAVATLLALALIPLLQRAIKAKNK